MIFQYVFLSGNIFQHNHHVIVTANQIIINSLHETGSSQILIKGLFIVIWQRLTVIIKEWSNWRLGVMRGWYYQGPSGARSLRNMGTWKEEPDGRERDAPISLTLITP
jgi:hypothetical protein